jgi:hypothetical protein
MKRVLEYIYADFLERQLPALTERDVDMERIPGKALALIGMRRAGKTFLCYQEIQKLLANGVSKENILYINFEDDRLFGFNLEDCQSILDVFYGQNPEKKSEECYFFFDEIQNIDHWERFIRRLMDTEKVSVFVTGSSARLLSAEIATGLRGRSLNREVFPYSFEEYLRANSAKLNLNRMGSKTRLILNQHAERYCRYGGFPEIQGLDANRGQEILQSYVDAVVLRDVVERHRISNVEALRSLVYHILRNPATKLSVNKFYLDLKSRGLRISKDDLYHFLHHLTDAYLIFQVPIWSRSEKKKQVNPKKVYVIDNGILDAYSTRQTADDGAFLENLVFLKLRRRKFDIAYYVTKSGHEIDFVYKQNEQVHFVQVAWNIEDEETRERELRALREGMKEYPEAKCHIITLDTEESTDDRRIQISPLWKFMLQGSG